MYKHRLLVWIQFIAALLSFIIAVPVLVIALRGLHTAPCTSVYPISVPTTQRPVQHTAIPTAMMQGTPELYVLAFDRITQLLQQPTYSGYEFEQAWNYNNALLTEYDNCAVHAFRMDAGMRSKDLLVLQEEYRNLEACVIN